MYLRSYSVSVRQRRFHRLALAALAVGLLAAGARVTRASYQSTVTAASPVDYYRFEETNGNTTADLGANNFTATYGGGFTLNQPGIPGGDTTDNAVLLNGSSGFAAVSGSYTGAAYPLTIEGFFKTTSSAVNQDVTSLANNTPTTGGSENLGLYIESGKPALRIRSSASSDQSFQGSTLVNDGKWHQIVGVFDSAIQRELYVDGVKVAGSTASAILPNINTLGIGALARSGTTDYFAGTIDEVSVYNSALSASTISGQYMASGVPEPTSVALLAIGGIGLLTRRRRLA